MRLPYNSLPHTNDNLWRTGEEWVLAFTPCHSRHFCGDEVVWSCHTLILCSTEVNKSHDLPCRKPNSYIFSNQPFIHSPVSLISAYSFPVPTFSITLPSLPAQKCSLLTESIFTVYSQWTESIFFFPLASNLKEKIWGAYLSLVETSPSSWATHLTSAKEATASSLNCWGWFPSAPWAVS